MIVARVELVEGQAHVYLENGGAHRPDAACPCKPATPMTSTKDHPSPGVYVHRVTRRDSWNPR